MSQLVGGQNEAAPHPIGNLVHLAGLAVLMALGDATEDQVFTSEGKRQLQAHLAAAINGVLKEKEGFGGIGNVYFTSFVVQ